MSLFLALLKYCDEVGAVQIPHYFFTNTSTLQKVPLTQIFQLK